MAQSPDPPLPQPALGAAGRPRPPADLCPRCNGTGWCIEPDGGAGRAVRCECQKTQRRRDHLELAGIPSRYRRSRLRLFNTANPDEAVAAQLLRARNVSQRYLDSFLDPETGFRRSGLLYIGPPGVGKTHLATSVLVALIERYGISGRFVDFSTLLHQIQSTFDTGREETKSSILAPVIGAEVLVLDELGAQKPTEWVMDVLYLIMNTRYTEGRPTIFTTNYRLEDPRARRGAKATELLSHRISAALLSRLYEMAHPLELDGPDYRRTVKMHENPIGG
ncbi:MAG: ATP-binding protein [Acidobacteriota bacterium]